MARLSTNGIEIDYDDIGTGEPALLYMTAWCMSRSIYKSLIPKSAKHRRVLALDWRGHGNSERPSEDFGAEELIEDAVALIEAAGVKQVIPVASSHAGWIAIELRKRLGDRVPKLVLLDWLLLPPPPGYMDLVQGLSKPESWEQTREILFNIWLDGVDNEDVISFVKDEMGGYGQDTWIRSGREIGACYEKGGTPIQALSSLQPPVDVLHLYAQPPAPEYLGAQQDFARENQWFHVKRLDARSHFSAIEVPEAMAAAIEEFAAAPAMEKAVS